MYSLIQTTDRVGIRLKNLYNREHVDASPEGFVKTHLDRLLEIRGDLTSDMLPLPLLLLLLLPSHGLVFFAITCYIKAAKSLSYDCVSRIFLFYLCDWL